MLLTQAPNAPYKLVASFHRPTITWRCPSLLPNISSTSLRQYDRIFWPNEICFTPPPSSGRNPIGRKRECSESQGVRLVTLTSLRGSCCPPPQEVLLLFIRNWIMPSIHFYFLGWRHQRQVLILINGAITLINKTRSVTTMCDPLWLSVPY